MNQLQRLPIIVALAGAAFAANADTFVEPGDAPALPPGQSLPAGTDAISGSFTDGNDVDLYSFTWSGGVLVIDTFGSPEDTQLHLFDGAGVGIGENDDAAVGGLQSEIALDLAPGDYFIGITTFNNDALDGFGGPIFGFNNTFTDLNGNFIQGPESTEPLADWDSQGFGAASDYVISFSAEVGDGGEPTFTLLTPTPGEAGQANDFTTENGSSGTPVALYLGREGSETTVSIGVCETTVGVGEARLIGFGNDDDGDGSVTITQTIPAEAAGITLTFQAVDVAACILGGSEVVSNIVSETF